MVNRWLDGAEVWGNTTKVGRAYLSASVTVPSDTPRISPGVRYYSSNGGHMTTPSLSVQNSWVIGFGLRLNSSNVDWEWRFLSGASEQLRLEATDNGSTFDIKIMRGATQVAVTSEAFSTGIWHYFEFKVTLTNSGSYELRHNEQNVLSDAGPVDLQNLGSSGADGHSWFHNTVATVADMDDIYCNDSTGTVNNDFLGDTVMFALLPTSDQSVQWTPVPSSPATNYDKVDDAPDTTDDSDYVETDVNTEEDFYEFANTPATGIGSIYAVKVAYDTRMEGVGSATVRPRFKSGGGTAADGNDFVVNGTSQQIHQDIFDEDPVAASAWTTTNLDAGRFGMRRVS